MAVKFEHNLASNETRPIKELLIESSLALIIMDLIRYFLIYDQTGLPLGMIGAQTDFSSLSYFWSPEFWGGLIGFTRKRTRLLVGLYMVVTVVIITLASSVTATLIIPRYRNDWVGGSATFWLAGNSSELFPDILDENSIGGTLCTDPSIDTLTNHPVRWSQCIWSGYSVLMAFFASREASPSNQRNQPLYLYDSTISRRISLYEREYTISPETWALCPDVASSCR